MQGRAEFDIIGNVGRIAEFSNSFKVNICANYKYKDDLGNPREHEYWNTVTVFKGEPLADFVGRYLHEGDLVTARGRMRTAKYEKNGVTVYTTNLVANDIQQIVSKTRNAARDTPTQTPPARQPEDDAIPF